MVPPLNGSSRSCSPPTPRRGDEVAGQPDALYLELEPPPNLDEDERQRDRNAEPPIEHVVQIAVARIGVVLDVSREPLFLEEAFAEPVELAEGIALRS